MSLRIIILFISIVLIGNSQAQAARDNQIFIKLIHDADLGHLNDRDKIKLIKLLRHVVSTVSSDNKAEAEIAERAVKYMSEQGYEPLYLQIKNVQNEDWLVVKCRFASYATKDIPIMLSTVTFRDGYYFCKSGIGGGITDMIDNSGREHSFMFADWKDLR